MRTNVEAFRPLYLTVILGLAAFFTVISCKNSLETEIEGTGTAPVSLDVVISAAKSNNVALLREMNRLGANLAGRDDEGRTPLMHAAAEGAVDAAEYLACSTGTIRSRDQGGASAFAHAIANAHLPVAKMLLCSGALVEETGAMHQPLLVTTVVNENHPAMLLLLENRAGHGLNPALREAFKKGAVKLANDLLRFGASPDIRIDGTPLLMHAIRDGNEEMASLLLRYGADPDKTDREGENALLLALQMKEDALAERLLAAGANPNAAGADGRPPLLRLAESGQSDRLRLVEELLKKGGDATLRDKNEVSLLGHALTNGRWPLVETLIENGANPDAACRGVETPIEVAFNDKNAELAEFLLKRDAAPHPVLFHRALDSGSTEIVDLYLDYGANVDARCLDGDTALSKCVRKGDLKMAKHLIYRGANLLTPGKEGQEPLVIAVATRNAEMTKMLLDCGADPDRRLLEPYTKAFKDLADSSRLSWYMARDSHFYPIMVAAATGHGDTIRVLLESGARQYPYTRKWKRYPISFAAEGNHIEAQQLLVGYDPKKAKEKVNIVVNLTTQKAVLYKDGKPALNSPVSTGKAGYRTPTGEYVITHKHRHWTSTLYGSSMPYFMRLSCAAFGLHVGYLPGYPASHGCIRMPQSGARSFWGSAPVGTPVSIVK